MTAPPVQVGVFGKLPSRGDFIRLGLPREFVEPWDGWWQSCIVQAMQVAGDDWLAAWLEAPVWRFALGPGTCGPLATVGLWMPSVDRTGRYFPLTLAAVGAGGGQEQSDAVAPFLDALEDAGRDALAYDTAPDALLARVRAAHAGLTGAGWPNLRPGTAAWWTEGSGRVAPARWSATAMPGPDAFAAMIDDAWDDGRCSREPPGRRTP